ncbi:MAG TPA: 2-C-methyl-D-erythritol 4-phosphate cytidylyltransferase [Flavobacteriales bacterium]|nr:2-C-methyl-D-erythritol 4-phosphate cytidylyltransferase [Flavobacteriales bacterium]
MNTYVIIVAGGKGSRMSAAQPKQFLPIKGKAILQHTLEAFHKVDPTFKYIVVLPEQHIEYWNNHCVMKKFPVKHTVIKGGDERFHSVRNAVESITGNGIVLIHDGVRPLVSKQTIKRVIETTQKSGNAVPVLPVVESLRKNELNTSVSVDRKNMFTVQTPQGFTVDVIKEAYRLPFDSTVTDDAGLVERCGIKINTVEGNRENIKITDPFDLKLAEFYLE